MVTPKRNSTFSKIGVCSLYPQACILIIPEKARSSKITAAGFGVLGSET